MSRANPAAQFVDGPRFPEPRAPKWRTGYGYRMSERNGRKIWASYTRPAGETWRAETPHGTFWAAIAEAMRTAASADTAFEGYFGFGVAEPSADVS